MNNKVATDIKKREIVDTLKGASVLRVTNDDAIAYRIVDAFSRITPPDYGNTDVDYLTISSGNYSHNTSIKPGNVLLNWRKLLVDASESIITMYGVVQAPILVPLAGLIIWNKIWSNATVEIDAKHAAVLWAMWQNRDKDNKVKVEEDVLLKLVNAELQRCDIALIGERDFASVLMDLEKMDCIELSDGRYWLREWVKKSYT